MQIINHPQIFRIIPFLVIGSCVMASSLSYSESITSKQSRSEMQNVLGRQLDELIADFIDDEELQGAVLAVKKNDESIYFAAHGLSDVATNKPMKTDSIFQMDSSTKIILASAAMIAIEQGLFDPNDMVSRYLPEFQNIQVAVLADPQNKNISPLGVFTNSKKKLGILDKFLNRTLEIIYPGYYFGSAPPHRLIAVNEPLTIHHLLTHTGGLGTYGLGQAVAIWAEGLMSKEKDVISDLTLAKLVDLAAAGPLDFQPGERFGYSSVFGLDVVARIIEITSDQPFNEFVKTNIFEPLDMRDTHWNLPPDKKNRLVRIAGEDKDAYSLHDAEKTSFFSGSVGLVSTASDFLNLHQMLANDGQFRGRQVLSTEALELMTTNHAGDLYAENEKGSATGEGFGYGVTVTIDSEKSKKSLGAFGFGGASGTVSWSDPKNRLAVVIMIQQPSTDFHEAVAEIIQKNL